MVSYFANRKWHNISHIVSTFDTIGLGYPILSVNIIVILLSVALLVIGVERIASGIVDVVLSSSLQKTKESSSRRRKVAPFTNIGLGTVAIVFAIIALVSPALMSERPLTLLSVAISVMFNGLARVIQGAFDKNQSTWFRTFSIGIGTLSIVTSIFLPIQKCSESFFLFALYL